MAAHHRNARTTVTSDGTSATGVSRWLTGIRERITRRARSRDVLRHTAVALKDAGWTRDDIVGSRVPWQRLLRHHGASDLVRVLELNLADARTLGIRARDLVNMSSDLHSEWGVTGADMVAVGATPDMLAARYGTSAHLCEVGITEAMMLDMRAKPGLMKRLYGSTSGAAVTPVPDVGVTSSDPLLPSSTAGAGGSRLEDVKFDGQQFSF